MTYATLVGEEAAPFDRRRLSRGSSGPAIVCSTAVAFGALVGAWLLADGPARWSTTLEHGSRPGAATTAARPSATAPLRSAARPLVARSPDAAPPFDMALLDPGYALGPDPVPLGASAPLGARFVPWSPPSPTILAASAADPAPPPAGLVQRAGTVAEMPLPPTLPDAGGVPLPTPRPPDPESANRTLLRPPAHRLADRTKPPTATPAPTDGGGFLEKFFGLLKPSGSALGYAAPEDGAFGSGRGMTPAPGLAYDRWTAVYDISAHTVFMPDGSRLEAHSGLGARLDDPSHVHERNVGATPPHVYDLQPREQLFHGVQALRLNPVGGGGVFGRTGLLAHTYMLGPKGDSNGCVSFKDYRAFLDAYRNGEVRRLVVVARAM